MKKSSAIRRADGGSTAARQSNFTFIAVVKMNSFQGRLVNVPPRNLPNEFVNLPPITCRALSLSSVTPRSSEDDAVSDKHPNNLLSSPHSGVLIGGESAFNFTRSVSAVPSCPPDPFFSLMEYFRGKEKHTHAETGRVWFQHLHFTGNTDLTSPCHESHRVS